VKNKELFSSVVWFLVGLGFLFGGLRLGYGRLSTPGPGFLPFMIGCVLSLLSILLFIVNVLPKDRLESQVRFWKEKESWKKVLFSFLSLIFYLIFLNYLGYIITTFLFSLYLFKFIGKRRWWLSILIAVLASSVSWVIFRVGMEVPLPKGMIKLG
jgi:putative tricarboxylic transport membrane protein